MDTSILEGTPVGDFARPAAEAVAAVASAVKDVVAGTGKKSGAAKDEESASSAAPQQDAETDGQSGGSPPKSS